MSKLKEWEDVMKGKLKKDYESNQPQQDQTYSGFQLVGGFSNIGSDFESLFQEAKNYANSFDSQLKTQFGFEDSLTKSERVVREFTEELARAGTSLGSFAKDVEQTFRYRSGDLRTTQEAGGSIGAYGQVTNNYNTLYMPTNATNEVKEVMTQGVMLYAQSNSNYASNAAQPIPMSPAMQKPQLMGGSRVTTNVNMSASSSYSNHVSQLKPNSAPPPSLKTNTNASIIRPNKPSKLSQNNELNSLGDDFVDRS
jgi:hypothetical protein